MQSYFNDFINLAAAISKHSHTGLNRQGKQRDTERARSVKRQSIDKAMRRAHAGPFVQQLGTAMPRQIQEQISAITCDTPENRYFKRVLKTTYRNMRSLSKVEQTGDEDAERDLEKKFFERIRPALKAMEKSVELILRSPFLEEVGEDAAVRPASMVFHKHPIYSRFDKMARLLNGGLTFLNNIVPIGVKDTALLYEYWCFLKIIELMREQFDLQEQSIVKFNRFKVTVTLAKGKSSAMRFSHSTTGKPLYVVYNRLFDRLPTIAQKPDNVIQIASDDRFYVFDAKYRVQFDPNYITQYGGPGPTTDDINTMHRYRDAIAIPHPMNPREYKTGVVIGAAVLFPYPDEVVYQKHKFYASLSQVEIGGLPFLPGATQLMQAKLECLLADEYGA